MYNKAEYAEQRRHMLQEWANMVDAWATGDVYAPTIFSASMTMPKLLASV